MRPPLDKLVPELQRQSKEAQELFAHVEFNPAIVRNKMSDAAKLGHRALRLKLPVHLDLRKTNAAAALQAWCKENELGFEWLSRETDLPDGRRGTVWEPEITW